MLYPFHSTTFRKQIVHFLIHHMYLITVVIDCFADCKLLQRQGSAVLNVFILSAFELKKKRKKGKKTLIPIGK